MEPITLTLDEIILKFKRPVLVDQNGCWNWIGSISSQGYAIFNHKLVYGLLYTETYGPCPTNKVLRHKCANKKCVRPDHITVGTVSENLIDSILDSSRGHGEAFYKQIHQLYKSGMRQADIAKRMNTSRSVVYLFVNSKLQWFNPAYFEAKNDKVIKPPVQQHHKATFDRRC